MDKEQKQGRAMQEIVSDAVERQLNQYPERTMSSEELEALVARRDAYKRRLMRKRLTSVAVLCLVMAGLFALLAKVDFSADADKNGKEEIITEDGVVIEDEGWGGENEPLIVTDWEKIRAVKDEVEALLIPEYIPEGYEFQELVVETLEGNHIICRYSFLDDENGDLQIHQYMHNDNLTSVTTEVDGQPIESSKGNIYIVEDEIKNATLLLENGAIVQLWCQLSDEEIIKMIENLN